jgi:oligopeptide transport system ATP-binding protein
MFEVSPTHGAKTWLLDPRSPKIKKPKQLNRLREAVSEAKVGE